MPETYLLKQAFFDDCPFRDDTIRQMVIFVVSGVINLEPDRMNAVLALGPRVMMSLAALERSEIANLAVASPVKSNGKPTI